MWGNHKKSNICVIGLERIEGEAEKIFEEILAKNFPNFVKEINLQIENAQTTYPLPKGIHSKKTMPSHIMINLLKPSDKDKS